MKTYDKMVVLFKRVNILLLVKNVTVKSPGA